MNMTVGRWLVVSGFLQILFGMATGERFWLHTGIYTNIAAGAVLIIELIYALWRDK